MICCENNENHLGLTDENASLDAQATLQLASASREAEVPQGASGRRRRRVLRRQRRAPPTTAAVRGRPPCKRRLRLLEGLEPLRAAHTRRVCGTGHGDFAPCFRASGSSKTLACGALVPLDCPASCSAEHPEARGRPERIREGPRVKLRGPRARRAGAGAEPGGGLVCFSHFVVQNFQEGPIVVHRRPAPSRAPRGMDERLRSEREFVESFRKASRA
jgi:hypothetical protein